MREVSLACQTCGNAIGVAQDFQDFLNQLKYYGVTGAVECLNCANMRFKIEKRNQTFKLHGKEPVQYGRI